MIMTKKILLFLSLCLISFSLCAQITVKAKIDSTAIFIGQQAHIELKVTLPAQQKATLPVYPSKRLAKGIEVLKEEMVATETLNDGKQTAVTKRYTITSFDSANYYIPPFKVKVAGKDY